MLVWLDACGSSDEWEEESDSAHDGIVGKWGLNSKGFVLVDC